MQVLIVGGSSKSCAGPDSPASSLSYIVNLAQGANHFPIPEQMPEARVVRPQHIRLSKPMVPSIPAFRDVHLLDEGLDVCQVCICAGSMLLAMI